MNNTRSMYQPNEWMKYGPAPAHPTPYEILIRQSRLLGRIATRASFFARQKISLPKLAHKPSSPLEEQRFFEQNPDEMHNVVERSREILCGAKTVILPYNIFPDTVTVDRMKVTINLWQTLFTHKVVTLRIEDILNVSARTGLLFGSLTISTRVMNSTDHFRIDGFWNRDVSRLKRLIQGYMIARHEGIDVSGLSTERLVRKLNELGNDSNVVK